MMDIKAASRLEDNLGNPFAPWLYAGARRAGRPVGLLYVARP
jgi:hypothetical protein